MKMLILSLARRARVPTDSKSAPERLQFWRESSRQIHRELREWEQSWISLSYIFVSKLIMIPGLSSIRKEPKLNCLLRSYFGKFLPFTNFRFINNNKYRSKNRPLPRIRLKMYWASWYEIVWAGIPGKLALFKSRRYIPSEEGNIGVKASPNVWLFEILCIASGGINGVFGKVSLYPCPLGA